MRVQDERGRVYASRIAEQYKHAKNKRKKQDSVLDEIVPGQEESFPIMDGQLMDGDTCKFEFSVAPSNGAFSPYLRRVAEAFERTRRVFRGPPRRSRRVFFPDGYDPDLALMIVGYAGKSYVAQLHADWNCVGENHCIFGQAWWIVVDSRQYTPKTMAKVWQLVRGASEVNDREAACALFKRVCALLRNEHPTGGEPHAALLCQKENDVVSLEPGWWHAVLSVGEAVTAESLSDLQKQVSELESKSRTVRRNRLTAAHRQSLSPPRTLPHCS